VQNVLNNNKICLLDIDEQGVKSIKKTDINALFVFIAPPSLEVSTVEFAYDYFGYDDNSPLMTPFVGPSRVTIFYVHSSLRITTSAKPLLHL